MSISRNYVSSGVNGLDWNTISICSLGISGDEHCTVSTMKKIIKHFQCFPREEPNPLLTLQVVLTQSKTLSMTESHSKKFIVSLVFTNFHVQNVWNVLAE